MRQLWDRWDGLLYLIGAILLSGTTVYYGWLFFVALDEWNPEEMWAAFIAAILSLILAALFGILAAYNWTPLGQRGRPEFKRYEDAGRPRWVRVRDDAGKRLPGAQRGAGDERERKEA